MTWAGQTTATTQKLQSKRRAARGEAQAFVEIGLRAVNDSCLLWPFGVAGNGYPRYGRGDVHVAVCERAHGPRPTPRHEAAHTCGNKLCISRQHVIWKTYEQNAADRVLHGTSNRGERQGAHKLTEAQVLDIRASKVPATTLAPWYGVSASHISRIRRREEWAWL